MSRHDDDYPRRDFLVQCAALPLAGGVVEAAARLAAGAEVTKATPGGPNAPPPKSVAAEIESLLECVDPELRYRHTPLAADKNAWPLWQEACKRHVEEPSDDSFDDQHERFLEGRQVSLDFLKRLTDWSSKNDQSRLLTDQGIARGAVKLPPATSGDFFANDIDYIMNLRRLASSKNVLCRLRLHHGDVTGAITEANSVIEMASTVLRGECLFIDYLVGIAILTVGKASLERAATAPQASTGQARKAIATLSVARPRRDDLKRALRVELCRFFVPMIAKYPDTTSSDDLAAHWLSEFDAIADELLPKETRGLKKRIALTQSLLEGHPRPFDKKDTVRCASNLLKAVLGELGKPVIKRKAVSNSLETELRFWPAAAANDLFFVLEDSIFPETKELSANDIARARDALRSVDNVLGKYVALSAEVVPNASASDFNRARIDASRLKIAFHWYQNVHSKMPAKLDELVDDQLLPEIPQDPYDGQPFKYSAERRVIWCAGEDGKNSGVISANEDPEDPFDVKLVWRIAKP